MNINQARESIYNLIEQTNAAGLFKTLQQLDYAREAFTTIINELESQQALIKKLQQSPTERSEITNG